MKSLGIFLSFFSLDSTLAGTGQLACGNIYLGTHIDWQNQYPSPKDNYKLRPHNGFTKVACKGPNWKSTTRNPPRATHQLDMDAYNTWLNDPNMRTSVQYRCKNGQWKLKNKNIGFLSTFECPGTDEGAWYTFVTGNPLPPPPMETFDMCAMFLPGTNYHRKEISDLPMAIQSPRWPNNYQPGDFPDGGCWFNLHGDPSGDTYVKVVMETAEFAQPPGTVDNYCNMDNSPDWVNVHYNTFCPLPADITLDQDLSDPDNQLLYDWNTNQGANQGKELYYKVGSDGFISTGFSDYDYDNGGNGRFRFTMEVIQESDLPVTAWFFDLTQII